MNSTSVSYTISDLAAEFRITPRTIRFWEDQGLLYPARQGGKRVFSRRDRTRLKLALRGKRLGLSLAEIKDLIGMYDTDRDDRLQLRSVLVVLAKRRAALEQQREDIEAVLHELDAFEGQCRALLGDERPVPAAGEASAPGRRFLAQPGDVDVNVS